MKGPDDAIKLNFLFRSQLSSTEWVVFTVITGIIWAFNLRLISSGAIQRVFRRHPINGQENTNRQLALTYEAIYGPPTNFVESESTKLWMLVMFALLLNVICIRLEILMFREMMASNEV